MNGSLCRRYSLDAMLIAAISGSNVNTGEKILVYLFFITKINKIFFFFNGNDSEP